MCLSLRRPITSEVRKSAPITQSTKEVDGVAFLSSDLYGKRLDVGCFVLNSVPGSAEIGAESL